MKIREILERPNESKSFGLKTWDVRVEENAFFTVTTTKEDKFHIAGISISNRPISSVYWSVLQQPSNQVTNSFAHMTNSLVEAIAWIANLGETK